jgi:endonuclease YncB( thermonuclease family)
MAAQKSIEVWAVSLNHKRRIFRAGAGSLGAAWPSPAVLLVAAGGALALVAATVLVIRPSDAPARAPATGHLSAGSDRLAVLDGDTLRVGEQVVRLEGIAAPPRGSACRGGGPRDTDCGVAAANALASLVRGSAVECTIRGHDDHGRPVGDCLAGGTRLSEALVALGWAHAEAADLRDAEASARAAGRGMWRGGT